MSSPEPSRRPLRTRDARWAQALAGNLGRAGVRPNAISVASVGFAALGAGALLLAARHVGDRPSTRVVLFVLAGGCIQLRLLCNLLDGLVAVEGGFRTPAGEIYNELPDRVSDVLLLAAAGYATAWTGWERDLGWAASAAAVVTAYVRALGAQAGAGPAFGGPMAKPQRMFVLTLACALTAGEVALGWPTRVMTLALALVAAGSVLTAARRTRRVVRELESRDRAC